MEGTGILGNKDLICVRDTINENVEFNNEFI